MVDLDDFIKLYLNHRPVERMGIEEVEAAFSCLSEGGILNREELLHALEVIMIVIFVDFPQSPKNLVQVTSPSLRCQKT